MSALPPVAREQVPATMWLIAGGVFAMVTSEFMAGGLLPAISDDVQVSLGAAALLISGFAAGQVVGSWLLGLPLSRFGPRVVLSGLLVAFAVAQTIGVLSPWPVMLGLRVVTGMVMSAYFSIALGAATRLVPGPGQPRAVAAVFAGVSIGTTLGLPLATFAGETMAWRVAFHLDTVVVLLAALAVWVAVPTLAGAPAMSLTESARVLRNGRLWLTFSTAGLAIGATLLAFGFFSAILQQVTGLEPAMVPWLLALYGLASVLGNWLVGRVTGTGPSRVVAIGLVVLAGGLLAFWAFPTVLPVAIGSLVAIGLSGVSLNAAHTARTVRVAGAHPAVMAMMPSVVTGGILLGTGAGALAVDSPLGLLAPLWMGAVLAGVSLLTLLPDMVRTPVAAVCPDPALPCPSGG